MQSIKTLENSEVWIKAEKCGQLGVALPVLLNCDF
jgi:hypothetical protein